MTPNTVQSTDFSVPTAWETYDAVRVVSGTHNPYAAQTAWENYLRTAKLEPTAEDVATIPSDWATADLVWVEPWTVREEVWDAEKVSEVSVSGWIQCMIWAI